MAATYMRAVKNWLKRVGVVDQMRFVQSALRSKSQRRRMRRFYAQFVPRGALCFDVGANVGERTRVFRQLGARVVAVEPQSACVRALQRRFQTDSKVTIVPQGLATAPGKAPLAVSTDSSTVATFSREFRSRWRWAHEVKWESEEIVELTTLDLLIKRYGLPDFCKIDVEGFEAEVLGGLSQRVAALSFEFNIELLDQTRKCVDLLKRLGYCRFRYSLGESMEFSSRDWMSPEQLFERIAKESEAKCWGDIYVSA